MYSAQRVSARNANIYLPFDRQFVDGGVQVTGNCGGKAPRPQYCTMGDGVTPATFPAQLDTRRGIGFGNGFTDYATVPADCIVDAQPFTIAALVSNVPRNANPVFYTMSPYTMQGVDFSITNEIIKLSIGDDTGSLISATHEIVPSAITNRDMQQRSFMASYDASGLPTGISLFLDGSLVPATTLGSISSSIVSGLDAILGALWIEVDPFPVVIDPSFANGIIHTLAVYPFAFTEHMAGILDARMRAEIHVLEDAKYTPV